MSGWGWSSIELETKPLGPSAFIGLGSNLGDRLAYLVQGAVQLLTGGQVTLVNASAVYETKPWGKTDQPPFLNAVLEVETGLLPEQLLSHCLRVEKALGRVRHERWGPRTLDLDLLVYGPPYRSQRLILPHERLHERAFALKPLSDLAPDLLVGEKRVREWLAELPEQGVTEVLPRVAFLDKVRQGFVQ